MPAFVVKQKYCGWGCLTSICEVCDTLEEACVKVDTEEKYQTVFTNLFETTISGQIDWECVVFTAVSLDEEIEAQTPFVPEYYPEAFARHVMEYLDELPHDQLVDKLVACVRRQSPRRYRRAILLRIKPFIGPLFDAVKEKLDGGDPRGPEDGTVL